MTDDGTRPTSSPPDSAPRGPRPLIERIGLAAIAFVLAVMFGFVAIASWVGGEPFLATMGAIGCGMTVWVGTMTLLRGLRVFERFRGPPTSFR